MDGMTTHSRGYFRWKLKETLDAHNITRYALQKETGIAMNTVRAMYDGTPARADFPIIEKVVAALSTLTHQPMTAADVLIWEGAVGGKALLNAGAADLKDQLETLEADTPAEQLQSWAATFQSQA